MACHCPPTATTILQQLQQRLQQPTQTNAQLTNASKQKTETIHYSSSKYSSPVVPACPGQSDCSNNPHPTLPKHIEQAILKALAKNRADRHADVATFVSALHKSSEQWIQDGNALRNLNRYEEAIAAYEQALRLNPNDANAYFGKGVALERLGKSTEAQQAYAKARQLGYNG